MLTDQSADDMIHEALKVDNEAARTLGFKPFNKVKALTTSKGVDLVGTCPLCGTETHFDSIEEIGKISEITNPNTGKVFKVNSCKTCEASRQEGKSDEKLNREINPKLMKRVSQILNDKFGAKFICTKGNMFASPNEMITFKKGEEKYEIPLKTIMAYTDDGFENIDEDFVNAEEEPLIKFEEEDIYAINKHTGETTYIEDFLLHPERDSILDVQEAEDSENTESEPEETPIIEGPVQNEETDDETEITENDIPDESQEATDDGDDSSEVSKSISETPDSSIDESDGQEVETEETDETEITENDVSESEFEEGTSEVIEDAPKIEVKEEEKSSESGNIEISLDIDDSPKEESSGPLFGNLFGNNKSEEKKEESSEGNLVESDDGEIIIDIDKDAFPFSVASEVEESGNTEDKTESKVSPIISEARNEEESEVNVSSLEETTGNDEEEIELDLSFDNNKSENKKDTVEKNDDERLDTNHHDALFDEVQKTKENDKKWYNNPVFVDQPDHEINEFMDEEDLIKEFQASKLGKVIYEVSQRTNIEAQFMIDENTYEIPVVDFKSGLRVICIDCDNVAQMKVHSLIMERNVPFAYKLPNGEKYRKLCLYSDSLNTEKRTKATIRNLIKNVNREKFNPYRIVNLAGNYTLFYTDSIPVIRSFEEENASYPQGKPCTKSIGIIALRPNSGKHEEFTAKDFMNFLNKNYKMDMKNHNLYMVATARYIVQPMPERKVVKYIITEYDELSSTILKDGLDHIVGAIVKEHKMNNTVKDPRFIGTDFSTYSYEFEYEFDASVIPSPSLDIWYDNNDLFRFPDSFEDGQGKCYIRSPEYRASPQDGYRKDPRLFLPIPFSKMFKAEIQKDGVNVLNDKVRRQYIERLGFIEAYYPRMKRFILNPLKVMKLELTSSIFGMSKVDLNKFFSGNGIYDGGYDNILMQKFLNSSDMDPQTKNVMNALLIQKMMNK